MKIISEFTSQEVCCEDIHLYPRDEIIWSCTSILSLPLIIASPALKDDSDISSL